MASVISSLKDTTPSSHTTWYVESMEHLIDVVQELSLARDLTTITTIIRDAARSLTGADGATFVLRDGDQCYYAEENAIAPLWKGRRFPMSLCISGWVMLNKTPAVIKDIYQDERIPADAYRPTFVKSLVMVPVRRDAPIAAIGNYWATQHKATEEEISILQALADTTSVALENIDLYGQLKVKIDELERSNHDLGSFAWAASHDIQEPLRTIRTQIEMLEDKIKPQLKENEVRYIKQALKGTARLQHLIQNLYTHAHVGKERHFKPVNIQQLMDDVVSNLQVMIDEHTPRIIYEDLPTISGDSYLLESLFQNLLTNAIKFHRPEVPPEITITSSLSDNEWIFDVKDNGIGIAPEYHEKIFSLFQRLNSHDQYPGAGVGLATCQKIVKIHGGCLWVESEPGKGSCFRFSLSAGSGGEG